MSTITESRKTEYSQIICKKGEELFYKWGKNGWRSKRIVSKANEFALEKPLRNNVKNRISAVVFLFALEMRINRRYKSFWQKFFHFIAYFNEVGAFNRLKRALGYNKIDAVYELLTIELEKAFEEIAKTLKNTSEAKGGKSSLMGDVEMEFDAILAFAEEEVIEEKKSITKQDKNLTAEQKNTEISSKNNEEKTKSQDKQPQTTEKKSQAEKSQATNQKDNGKSQNNKEFLNVNSEQTKEGDFAKKQQEEAQRIRINALLSDITPLEFAKEKEEEQSPFPIFRDDEASVKTPVEENENQRENGTKEEDVHPVFNSESDEKVNVGKGNDGEEKQVIPVFDAEKGKDVNSASQKREESEKPIVKAKTEVSEGVREKMYVSEENLMRRELNLTMTEEQIIAIAEAKIENAKAFLDREEALWREKISILVEENKTDKINQIIKEEKEVVEQKTLKNNAK